MKAIRTILFAGAVALAACERHTAPDAANAAGTDASEQPIVTVTGFSVEHGAIPGEYRLHWSADVPSATVRLEATSDLDDPRAGMVIAEEVTDDEFRWRAPPPARRWYFSVVPKGGDPVVAGARLLPLEGGRNFRDLGGYRTEDGRSVQWGRVFRSGVMTNLTEQDYRYLASIDVATICDYRSEDERRAEPTRWGAGEVDYVTFPDPESPAGSSFLGVLRNRDATPEQVADSMAEGYIQLARDHAGAFGTMFDRLAAGEIPLAFNCSAGKDRAGISAALLLTALGVPRETVVADYALSEQLVDYVEEFRGGADEASAESGAYGFLSKLPLEILTPLMRSDPRYLETALDWMDAEYGSVTNFIREELDVSSAELSAIRDLLLD